MKEPSGFLFRTTTFAFSELAFSCSRFFLDSLMWNFLIKLLMWETNYDQTLLSKGTKVKMCEKRSPPKIAIISAFPNDLGAGLSPDPCTPNPRRLHRQGAVGPHVTGWNGGRKFILVCEWNSGSINHPVGTSTI